MIDVRDDSRHRAVEAEPSVALSRGGRRRSVILLSQLVIVVALVAVWALVGAVDKTALAFISSPTAVAATLGAWLFGAHNAWSDILATVRVALTGLVFGSVLAMVTALVLSQVRRLERFLSPFIVVANLVPKVALIPLFILWFGIGDPSKVVFVTVGVFFIVFYTVLTHLLQAEKEQRDHLRILGSSRLWIVRELLLPTAWGGLISSIRLSVAFALFGAVLTEMMASNQGLGYRLAEGQATLAQDQVIAAVVIVAVIGVCADTALSAADRHLAAWRRA